MTPEDAVEYLETLCRRHGIQSYKNDEERAITIDALRDNPDIIPDFIRKGELNIERVAADKEEQAA